MVDVNGVSGLGLEDEPRNGVGPDVDAGDDRLVGLIRVLGHLVQLVGDLEEVGVHVASDIELQDDPAHPVHAFTGEALEALYAL